MPRVDEITVYRYGFAIAFALTRQRVGWPTPSRMAKRCMQTEAIACGLIKQPIQQLGFPQYYEEDNQDEAKEEE